MSTTPLQHNVPQGTPDVVPLVRPDYVLSDHLDARQGTVFLTGTQALVRLLLMQGAADQARGYQTRGFISGYRGSPLGGVDQALWRATDRLTAAGVHFLPAVNEELAATAVLGTQRVESDPERTCAGVYALWYGKGPGLDRAGDALKHGNVYGASPHGGVLMVVGDDHGCVSSSMPHQSDETLMAWKAPVLSPGSVAELLEFGLYGWALSRFSGNWVGLTALSEVVESAATVDLDILAQRVGAWVQGADLDAALAGRGGYHYPPGGLHYRWPDLPSLALETRLQAKLDAVRAFARVNSVDRVLACPEGASLGIVTAGKAHYDFLEVLRRLGLSLQDLAAAGIGVYKLGLTYPIEPGRMEAFAGAADEILVIEEKAPVVAGQMQQLFYNHPRRPRILGKEDENGAPLFALTGELRPSRLMAGVAAWLARHRPHLDRRALVVDFLPPPPPQAGRGAEGLRRAPYFCAGCPHNTSTRLPQGSKAHAGIGCHFMATWMGRETEGLIQMGGEGVDWVSHAQFTRVPHLFQNLGDGTYYHSGYLAIRQAVAAGAAITYKILYNDAVAMTGGQPVDGITSVDRIARQVEAEGVKQIAVVSDDIARYRPMTHLFPAITSFHPREELDTVQRLLREVPGVTVLIYEQTCAAEKRRRRKQGLLPAPSRRLVIHPEVCEGCGDCSRASNCVAILPLETPLGRKRRIDQTHCNQDEACLDGFCPSFVGVVGGRPRRQAGLLQGEAGGAFAQAVAALPGPAPRTWVGPYDLLITGVGGTGVVTLGALVAMAAHLEGKAASVLDFMGFAQKGGAVLSFVRLAADSGQLNQARIDAQQADALLACDLVVGAAPETLQTLRRGRTRVLANTFVTPLATSLQDPDAGIPVADLLARLEESAGPAQVETLDAQSFAQHYLGDTLAANILVLGYAWQRGLVPLGLAALMRALVLNGVAVPQNQLAFSLGRMLAADPESLDRLCLNASPSLTTVSVGEDETLPAPLPALIVRAQAHLRVYQNAAYGERYRDFVARVAAWEGKKGSEGEAGAASFPLTRAVARTLWKLMAYKDEYEVARLLSDPGFAQSLAEQFEGDITLEFHLAPSWLPEWLPQWLPGGKASGEAGRPRKRRFGQGFLPVLRLLARGKVLRGRWCDPFGLSGERRQERALIEHYQAQVLAVMASLGEPPAPALRDRVQALFELPLQVRGYGPVKAQALAALAEQERGLLAEILEGGAPVVIANRPPSGTLPRRVVGVARVGRA